MTLRQRLAATGELAATAESDVFDGTLQFRRDIYDRDGAVTRALRDTPPR